MIDLHKMARYMGIRPSLVMEVGVNEPQRCSLSGFIRDGIRAVLVEPLPWCAANLRKAFPNAEVIEAACGEKDGEVVLFDRGEGSWIEDVKEGGAPDEHPKHSGMRRDRFEERYRRLVRSIRFDRVLDPMKPDILAVDIEGAEWMVVGQMNLSRPKLIRLELHFTHSGYRNPDRDRILERLSALGYEILVEDISDCLLARID